MLVLFDCREGIILFNQYAKVPKLNKPIAEQYIAHSLRVHPHQLNFVKLVEKPTAWKHACVPTGANVLTPRAINYYGTPIEFVVCTACRKVQYHFEDMY